MAEEFWIATSFSSPKGGMREHSARFESEEDAIDWAKRSLNVRNLEVYICKAVRRVTASTEFLVEDCYPPPVVETKTEMSVIIAKVPEKASAIEEFLKSDF